VSGTSFCMVVKTCLGGQGLVDKACVIAEREATFDGPGKFWGVMRKPGRLAAPQ